MTVSDPHIKNLKGWTRKLTEYGSSINDDHPDLVPFCESLEKCLEKGVSMRVNSFTITREPFAWNWIKNLASINESSLYILSSIVDTVSENKKTTSSSGKLKLFIRLCLIRKYLHIPIAFVIKRPALARDYYDADSIIGNEILGEIFVSVLMQISRLDFKLNLRNASFLDDSWELPVCEQVELVPCKTLGISVCFIHGKALIANLDENSVAAEDGKIQIGDILDEINSTVINVYSKHELHRIMRKAHGFPITLHIIKLRLNSTNEIYGPIASIIRASNIEHIQQLLESPVKTAQLQLERKVNLDDTKIKDLSAGFPLKYYGSISTGFMGDVKQIERAIRQLLLQKPPVEPIPVFFECLEIEIKVISQIDGTVILKKYYMEISSCGRTPNIPCYFAFISGETTCSVAKTFEAHIFYHEDFNEMQLILQSLRQGFYRTHYAV